MSSKRNMYRLVSSAFFIALAMGLPFLTGQIPQIGNMLCPMHFPIFLCGFFCGPWYGLAVGFISPLLRNMLFGMPPIIPIGLGMCFELSTYGFVSGYLYKVLPKRKVNIYISLIVAMLIGRVVWGIVRVILLGIGNFEFGWTLFIFGAFINAIPAIIIQIILIPILVIILMPIFENEK